MFEFFEHTADLGIQIESDTLEGVFESAANAFLTAIIQNPEKVKGRTTRTFEIHGADHTFLLRDFLNHLLLLFETQHLVFSAIQVSILDKSLHALAFGEEFQPQTHGRNHEVKAITYHGLSLIKLCSGYRARLVVDI